MGVGFVVVLLFLWGFLFGLGFFCVVAPCLQMLRKCG